MKTNLFLISLALFIGVVLGTAIVGAQPPYTNDAANLPKVLNPLKKADVKFAKEALR